MQEDSVIYAKGWLLLQANEEAETILKELERLEAFEAKVKEVNRRRASTGGKGAMSPARRAAQLKAVEAASKVRRERAQARRLERIEGGR